MILSFKPLIVIDKLKSYSFSLSPFIIIILTITIFDTFSYFFGSFIGRKKMLLSISPNKTYEGLIGGVIFTTFTMSFFNYIFTNYYTLSYILIILSYI